MRIYLISLLLFLIFGSGYAQTKPQTKYLGTGPEVSMMTNAIVRNHSKIVHFKSKKHIDIKEEFAITILDNEGKDEGEIAFYYSNFSKITKAVIWIYDENGEKIENIRLSQMEDEGFISYNMYDDQRRKYYKPLVKKTPYTVHFVIEETINDFFHLPSWYPQPDNDVYVEKASLEIINTSGEEYQYFMRALPDSIYTFEESENSKKWTIENLPAFIEEKYSLPTHTQLPRIVFPLEHFQVEAYEGSLKSWEDFGQWSADLKEGRQELSPETIIYIHSLTDTIVEDREKAKLVYKWMQSQTRYVSIQLGVGGWQPFDALEVDEKKYGDCKGLTNYTQALLQTIGVDSYYCLVHAGGGHAPLEKDKVFNQFNHVILCLPLHGDTTFLECTSNTAPFGFQGSFTDDRYALLINDGNSKLVKTKRYNETDNLLYRNSSIQLDDEGGFQGSFYAEFHNVQINKRRAQLDESLEDRKEYLYKKVDINGFKINSLKYDFIDSIHPCIKEDIDFSIRKFASTSNTKMFLPLFYFNASSKKIKKDKNRINDIVIKRGSTELDTIAFQIPPSYQLMKLPDTINLVSDFGIYESISWQEGNQIYYVRKNISLAGQYPPERFEEFRKYRNSIIKADKATAILERKNNTE
ncbi:DUF3857 domain-containing protein [Lentimicrobium sp. S6]|uniref:DUF3857 domain-containing protein n=1 Tax=Lentimicrobium sp. S6 TaxID=2735872 RepID=UPI001552D802|nr:DUF3857 domain-containing protein [Lentimicrobium sp. S6]NPD45725.1 hypothetical protein [Lentimicrobium sp. S6]